MEVVYEKQKCTVSVLAAIESAGNMPLGFQSQDMRARFAMMNNKGGASDSAMFSESIELRLDLVIGERLILYTFSNILLHNEAAYTLSARPFYLRI